MLEEKKNDLGILKADTFKQAEMKKKVTKKTLRRTWKLLENKICSRNFIKGMNTWVVSLVRYSGQFLKWTRKELRQIDQRIGTLMTKHKALTREMTQTGYICQEKKKEEDSQDYINCRKERQIKLA